MRILYANPVFLDYRLPFYKELNRLFQGKFHLLYSKQRYQILHREDLYERIKEEMGENAHPIETDYLFDTNSMSFKMKDIERGRHIPFTFGLIRKIKRIKPDIIITEGFFQWTPLVIIYSMVFKIPVYIGYERTPFTERNAGKFKTWHRQITNKFIKGYFVNGRETKRYLLSIGIEERKIHIGGMSADDKGFKKNIDSLSEQIKQEIRRNITPRKGLLYLFVGRLCRRKGIKELLKVWNRHLDRHYTDTLLIVGEGEYLDELKKNYNIPSVIFTGGVDYNTIYKYYATADVFILPTLEDNWSLVVPEAMSCGLPVATSIYNGCHPELVIKDRNGYVFDPLNETSILATLDYFHCKDLKRMGLESIIIEREFNTDNCARRVHNAILKDFNHD